MKRRDGFTLIELLVAIAIIGIISSIAYPSYRSYLLKTRRGEAMTDLMKAQLQQTSLRILATTYSTENSALGLVDNDNYTYSVTYATSTTYKMQAVAKGDQVDDTGCITLTIDQNSNQTPLNCW